MKVKVTGSDGHFLVRLDSKRERIPSVPERQVPCDLPPNRYLKGGIAPKNDWMKQRAYDAERPLAKVDQKRFETFLEVARYYASLMATEWFGRRWPCFNELKVVYQPGSRGANATPRLQGNTGVISGRVTLSTWAIGAYDNQGSTPGGEWMLLHELAHALCPKEHWHSPLWARTYLELVKFRIGEDGARVLKAGFDAKRVRYRPYRVVSPAQREALAERMRKLRKDQGGQSNTPTHTILPDDLPPPPAHG